MAAEDEPTTSEVTMDAQTALDTLLARVKEGAEYARFASGDPDIESLAVPVFLIESVIADLTQAPSNTTDSPTVADLDGTDDAADWIAPGHVLEVGEVAYLRSLRTA